MVRRKLTSTTAVLFLAFVSTVGAATGDITTVAGVGTAGSTGDNGRPRAASLAGPGALEPLPGGGSRFADTRSTSGRRGGAAGTSRPLPGGGPAGSAVTTAPQPPRS